MVQRLLRNQTLVIKVFYGSQDFLLCVRYGLVFPNVSPLSPATFSVVMPFAATST
jgi:hypothetical protein